MIDLMTIAFCIVLINIFLCVVLFIAWRVQKVYVGFRELNRYLSAVFYIYGLLLAFVLSERSSPRLK
jgi:hypothetical protein